MKNAKLVFPILLALAGCADSPAELQEKARAAYAAHDFRLARLLLSQALTDAPGNRDLLMLQARSLLAMGDGYGAEAPLKQLVASQPDSPDLTELLAEAALLRKQPDAALALLGAVKSVEAERLRALAAVQKENPDAARQHLATALAMGGNARACVDMGRLELMAGNLTEAQALAAKARKLAPQGIDTLLFDGQLAVRGGDLAKALAIYDQAAKAYPTSMAALTGKAAMLGDLGRLDEMEAVTKAVGELAPDDPTVLYLRARLGAAKKDWSGTRGLIEKSKADLGVREPLRLIYGETLLRLGQNQQAIAQLGPMVRATPGNREAALLLAEAQMSGGDNAAAVATLRPLAMAPLARREELAMIVKAAKASGAPDLAALEARLASPAVRALGADLADGDKAMRAGNWAGAAEAYARILETTDGRNPLVLNNMAYAQIMLGDFTKANEFAQRALKAAPGNASVLDTAGWALYKSGKDNAEAKRLLGLAAEKAPGNATIKAHLAEAERASI